MTPAVSKEPMRWMGSLDAPHLVAYLPDVARAYVTLGSSDKADGEIWILPHAPAVSGREFLELVNAQLDEPVKTSLISSTMLRVAAPFHRMSRESLDVLYQWTEPFVVHAGKFQRVFGPLEVTPLDEAIRVNLAWYSNHQT